MIARTAEGRIQRYLNDYGSVGGSLPKHAEYDPGQDFGEWWRTPEAAGDASKYTIPVSRGWTDTGQGGGFLLGDFMTNTGVGKHYTGGIPKKGGGLSYPGDPGDPRQIAPETPVQAPPTPAAQPNFDMNTLFPNQNLGFPTTGGRYDFLTNLAKIMQPGGFGPSTPFPRGLKQDINVNYGRNYPGPEQEALDKQMYGGGMNQMGGLIKLLSSLFGSQR